MPSKLGFGNSRKKTSSPVTMGSPMHFKNPVKMDHAMKMKDLSGDGKITKKDVLIGRGVIDPPTKMYGSKPMKHSEDSAGIRHGKGGHLKPADDVATRGKAATDFYSKQGAAPKMAHSPKKMAHSPKKMAHSPKKMAHSPKKMYGKKK